MSTCLVVFLIPFLMTSYPCADGIKAPEVHGWSDVQIHNNKKLDFGVSLGVSESFGQNVKNLQECMRLCWRVSNCRSITYTPHTSASCRLFNRGVPSSSAHLMEDNLSLVVEMSQATLNKVGGRSRVLRLT